ncbi:MAG: hypothetical protein A2070_03980 [Bdellovibrionales bacterium GWC1_52_8]|nr:MAG: hypothetical protein A2X97_13040 [Bdellovibrionales bacterium GWA1_52_35]OFZ44044.1 MAG: hypothetical protein A2070_03980 [Bdellovibrionales bacterium GWC1_52_8]
MGNRIRNVLLAFIFLQQIRCDLNYRRGCIKEFSATREESSSTRTQAGVPPQNRPIKESIKILLIHFIKNCFERNTAHSPRMRHKLRCVNRRGSSF